MTDIWRKEATSIHSVIKKIQRQNMNVVLLKRRLQKINCPSRIQLAMICSSSGFFFPPQDFLIPIRHLGSAIQLTEEVSVIHFSFPTQNNYVRKKGDLNFKLHRQQEFTPFGWCRRFSTKPVRRIQCSLTWGSMAGVTGKCISVLVN